MKTAKRSTKYILGITLCFILLFAFAALTAQAAETGPVASLTVGDTTTEYNSFSEALAAASKASGNRTITLLRDTTEIAGDTDDLFYTGRDSVLTVDFGTSTLTCDEFKTSTYSSVKLVSTGGGGVNGNITFYGPDCSIDSGVYHGTIGTWLMGDLSINGGTFTSDGKLLVADIADIDITGGTFTGADGIHATDDGRIFINGGTFTLTNSEKSLLLADSDGLIAVYDGTFTADTDINADSTADMYLYGGTFIGGIKVKTTTLADCLRAGEYDINYQYMIGGKPQSLTSGQQELTGGDVTVRNLIAKVNSEYYSSLSDAASAFADGGTFTLLTNCRTWISSTTHWITLSGGGTFDLNGHTLTANGGASVLLVTAGSTPLTIKDSSANGTGSISGAEYSILHNGTGTVTVESGTYQNFGRIASGSLIINGGTFKNNAFANVEHDGAKITLNGGTFLRGIRFTTGLHQNVYDVLGTGKTYQIGEEIWARDRVQALGNVYNIGTNSAGSATNLVKIVSVSDAVATITENAPNGTMEDMRYFTSLSAAVAYAAQFQVDAFDYVTLLKETDENITIPRGLALHIVFSEEAGGTFTFEPDSALYLNSALPDGMKLRVKYVTYPTAVSIDNCFIWKIGTDALVTVEDIIAVDAGVKVGTRGAGIGLYHAHEWNYKLTEAADTEKISVLCSYPQSCPYSEGTEFASVTLRDVSATYNSLPHPCSMVIASLGSDYSGQLPSSADVVYTDKDGNKLDGAPVDAGTYTAAVTFGDKTAEAAINILPAALASDDFLFTPPESTVYDGTFKEVLVDTASDIVGMGEITISYYDSEGNLLDGAPIDAGTYSVKISVAAGKNYTAAQDITSDTWTFTITPKPIIVTADDTSKVYGEEDPNLSVTAMGLVEIDTITVPLVREEGENAGTYAIRLAVSENEIHKNYTVTFIPGIFTIDPKPVTAVITLSQNEFTYDGTAFKPTVIAKDGTTVIPDSEYTVVYKNNKRPGTATVTLKDNEGGNYIVSGSTTFTIVRETVAEPSPTTGDSSGILAWLALLLASGVGIAGLALFKRQRKSKKQK